MIVKNIIEAENVNKVYRIGRKNTQHVLKDVNLQVKEGEFVAVMGASGSGKSTLLYSLSGMDRPTAGRVDFCGENISALSEDALAGLRLERMGFIFQQSRLLRNLNIFDNIVLASYLRKQEERPAINQRAAGLMERMGIPELADKEITEASGGQLQRVSICRALMNRPEILFGDEPTGALNSRAAMEVMELLAEINRTGTAIMLVTHDPRVAARTERVLFMSDGQIVGEMKLGKFCDTAEDLKERERRMSGWLGEMGF